MSLETTRKGISEILDILKKGEWQIPQFQRDFIWSPEQVKNLIYSFIKSYPIGLITIWQQPQNNPHTPGEPLKLKDGAEFKEFQLDPALIKLVLDGKQRLTTLAMVFGGLHSKDDRFAYSGGWFVDLRALYANDETNIVKYKKQKEIAAEDLSTLTVCVKKGLIPLKDFHKLNEYLANINNPDIYPTGEFPAKSYRDACANATSSLIDNYTSFLIPIAEIPSTVDLGSVCEIFDVLNTTGTKVSTFDLIHNLLFKDSRGSFLLREYFKSYTDLDNLGLLCDERRQEFYCQIVTGTYLSENSPTKQSNSKEFIASIKGKDLIDTPLNFYVTVNSKIEEFDKYTKDLFVNVLDGKFRLSEIPYPVQIILYISLRRYLDLNGLKEKYISDLNKIFKAFFWRNTLTSRYDQGFLTQFTIDLKFLRDLLKENIEKKGIEWAKVINEKLKSFFEPEYVERTKENLKLLIINNDLKGALAQGITLLLNSKIAGDLITSNELDRFTDEKSGKVQLHHIFPRQWCNDNSAQHPIINELGFDHFANLIPITASSNNQWKTLSPSTAVQKFKLNFNSNSNLFESGYIKSTVYDYLKLDKVKEFWEQRAQDISDDLHKRQFVN